MTRRKIEIEIPGPGEESVWDYPRPPSVETMSERIEIYAGGILIVETSDAIRICETASPPTYYVPRQSFLEENAALELWRADASYCEWKGMATYWSVRTDDAFFENCAWSYPEPNSAYQSIAGYLGFYPGRVECFVEREEVKPQPGQFYGGWITKRIRGPFKGEPGTMGW